MEEQTTVPQEDPQAKEPTTPGNQVPAGAQVPGVDVTTGIPDGTTDAEPKKEQAAPPIDPAAEEPVVPAEEPANQEKPAV